MDQNKNLTPLMKQYWEIKSFHQDKVLMFRMGDFFEMFFDDAVKAAPLLGIALTSRNKKAQDETPMCGVPHHSIAGPINRLLSHGLKVAICDQIEDPKFAKGIVKRAVTRILTPGMVYDPATLEDSVAHYLACYEDQVLACVDTTTGEAFYFEGCDSSALVRYLGILPIVEMVLPPEKSFVFDGLLISPHEKLVEGSASPRAVRRLISYLMSLGAGEQLKTLKPFERRERQGRLELSATVIRHLEIFLNSRGEAAGTLFQAVNRTRTSAGARLLRSRLCFPSTVLCEIQQRQDSVQRWVQDPGLTKKVREILARMGDVERRLGKIAQPQCNGRDLLALAQSIQAGREALLLAGQGQDFESLSLLAREIETTLVEDPPLATRQGHLIQKGVSPVLDELILLSTDSQTLLQKMETEEREKTGINSLKIRYNNVFGYYIEITHAHREKAPANYMRKQTLANAERYCTEELLELEKKVLSAQGRRFELEFEIFENLRKKTLSCSSDLLHLASLTSELDVASSLAWLALERRYTRPAFTESSLKITSGRHPVVEQAVKSGFVPNSLQLAEGGCLLLTGPNMAGKSTLMRQVALIALLAQAGSYVPADAAELPVFDQIFTRIGANDVLAEGLSTFMVEMTETSEMLKKATHRSLLILDEVGRGTSTFDGMSLAQAILEHILKDIKALTLFATHYHEITSLAGSYPQLQNGHMSVVENRGEIQFLHTLVAGAAQKSYGIQVARLAGLPTSITKRAESLLQVQERPQMKESSPQLSLLEDFSMPAEKNPILNEIREFPVFNTTPLEAMNKIAKWQEALGSQMNN